MDPFLLEIKSDFELFHDKEKYIQKLNNLSGDWGLPGKSRFLSDFLPTYFSGDIQSVDKIIILGINPGGSTTHLKLEQPIKEKSFDNYITFQKNFFSIYPVEIGEKIRYYAYLAKCFNTNGNSIQYKSFDYWKYCAENFVNIDLLPYHSEKFTINKSTLQISELLNQRINLIFDFLKRNINLPRFIVVHKKFLSDFLIDHYFFNSKKKIFSVKNKSVYLCTIYGFNILIFNRFIPNGGFSREEVQKALRFIN